MKMIPVAELAREIGVHRDTLERRAARVGITATFAYLPEHAHPRTAFTEADAKKARELFAPPRKKAAA